MLNIDELLVVVFPHQIIESRGDCIPDKIRIYGANGVDYIENIKKDNNGYSYTIHRFLDAKIFKDFILNKDKLIEKVKVT